MLMALFVATLLLSEECPLKWPAFVLSLEADEAGTAEKAGKKWANALYQSQRGPHRTENAGVKEIWRTSLFVMDARFRRDEGGLGDGMQSMSIRTQGPAEN